ncbi:hypothetical protein [Staphylococcus xylosus]|uniref:hypothetical protein n=1 Tax=Staphylococcus xylosus TaxID=1288 RepID=UPI001C3E9B53|nr:hypothetical protein [Staphylococcus xylosus]
MNKYTKFTGTVLASIFTLSLTGLPMAQANDSSEKSINPAQQLMKTNSIPKDAHQEGDHYVKYFSDQELKSNLDKQGYDTSGFESTESDSGINTYAAKKGGVTKAVYGKGKNADKVDLYLSHNATTGIVKAGATGAAGALGGLIGGATGGFIGSFAGHIVSTYGGKVVPKNGIIVKGNINGDISAIVSQ